MTKIALHSATRRKEEVMTHIVLFVNALRRRDEGQDLLEYALLIALIALVAIGGVTLAGVRVGDIFTAITNAIPIPG
jgi:Flp pilus assembly pilin Flp